MAFVSNATNLVADDTNGVADIFVHDAQGADPCDRPHQDVGTIECEFKEEN